MYFNKATLTAKFRQIHSLFVLAFCWIFALGLGYILACSTQEITPSLMHRIVREPVSIVGLAGMLFLPVILSAIAARFSMSWLMFLIAMLKGVCYGFCTYQLLIAYCDAAWLFRFLLMFSDSCMLIPLFAFWIRHLNGSNLYLRRDTIVLLLVSFAVGCIDYLAVSPFVLRLIEYI